MIDVFDLPRFASDPRLERARQLSAELEGIRRELALDITDNVNPLDPK